MCSYRALEAQRRNRYVLGTYGEWLLYKAAQMSSILKTFISSTEPSGDNLYAIFPSSIFQLRVL